METPVVTKVNSSLVFSNPQFKTRYFKLHMPACSVLFGKIKPTNCEFFEKCGLIKLLADVGLTSLFDIPSACYLNYVIKFYANLHHNSFGNYCSIVRSVRLCLNAPFLDVILKFPVSLIVDIFNARGVKNLYTFSALDQL